MVPQVLYIIVRGLLPICDGKRLKTVHVSSLVSAQIGLHGGMHHLIGRSEVAASRMLHHVDLLDPQHVAREDDGAHRIEC